MKIWPLIMSTCLLTACGGGSGGGESKTTPPVTPEPEPLVITEDNYDEIVIQSVLGYEAAMDISRLLESELLWVLNQYDSILKRDCANGGSVQWAFNSRQYDSGSATFTYDNCVNKDANSASSVFNGQVRIDYQIIERQAELTELVEQQKLTKIKTSDVNHYKINVSSSDFSFREFEGLLTAHVNFDFSTDVEQTWLADSEDQLSFKSRNIDISLIDVKVTNFFDFNISDAALTQSQNFILNDEPVYSAEFSGTFENVAEDIKGELTAEMTVPAQSDSYYNLLDEITGNLVLSTEDGQRLATFISKYNSTSIALDYSSIAGISTGDLFEENLLELLSNQSLFEQSNRYTHSAIIDISPDVYEKLSNGEEITLTFNHGVEVNSPLSDGALADYSVVKDQNKMTLTPLTNIEDGLHRYSLYYSNSPGNPQSLDFLFGIPGEIKHYDINIGELITYSQEQVTSAVQTYSNKAQFQAFVPNTREILRKDDLYAPFIQLCKFEPENRIYALGQNQSQDQLLEFDLDNLRLINIHELGVEYQELECQQTKIVLKTVASRDNDYSVRYGMFDIEDDFHYPLAKLNDEFIDYQVISNAINPLDSKAMIQHIINRDGEGLLRVIDFSGDALQIDTLSGVLPYTNRYPEYLVYVNKNAKHLYWGSFVYNLETYEQVFDFESLNAGEKIEFSDATLGVVVTNHAVYDASDFSVIQRLPELPRGTWQTGSDNQLIRKLDDRTLYVVSLEAQPAT
ncbi:hypothetical protein [Thalassotalea sp. PS06]|uniref:hypothetical protein n=1 Tax=Thalassotalea sp. PS06 TaxID=2594005 RepID=UPI001164C93A|nr:hypothetical protein [Thalassotalea sp. PS06]QDP01850.1 hypothetical protein FNC98_11170 [Thalassotalea sp. PS06]